MAQRSIEDSSLKLGLLPDPERISKRPSAPKREGHLNELGMQVADLDPRLRNRLGFGDAIEGVVVQSVQPRGRSHRAGLQPGDVIVRANRKPVRNVDGLKTIMIHSGEELLLRIRRGEARLFVVL